MENDSKVDRHNDRRHHRVSHYAEGACSQPGLVGASAGLLLHLHGGSGLAHSLQIHSLSDSGDHDKSDSLPIPSRPHVRTSPRPSPLANQKSIMRKGLGRLARS